MFRAHLEDASGHGSPATNKVGESEQIHEAMISTVGRMMTILHSSLNGIDECGWQGVVSRASSARSGHGLPSINLIGKSVGLTQSA